MFQFLKSSTYQSKQKTNQSELRNSSSYLYSVGKPVWSERNYDQFAGHAYIKNVIAYRSINMISQAAASVSLKLYQNIKGVKTQAHDHPIMKLLTHPNPMKSGIELLEEIYTYRQIQGNAYLLAVGEVGKGLELYSLRPDRVQVLAGEQFMPLGYRYLVDNSYTDYYVDQLTGRSQILHIKNFHPLSDWYGLSSVEAAAYSIDQHNQAGEWNQALLQNGARPSGICTVKDSEGKPSTLSTEQFNRVKNMIDESFCGPGNAGRPILLEGGLEWKEMSLTPKDMDFISSKHSSARDIALAFGVPPQLLGIPGDNTYSNLKEARMAFWEQTVLPLVDNNTRHLNRWLIPMFDNESLELCYDSDSISALSSKREMLWERINNISFMTMNEKRGLVGLDPV